MRGKKKSLENKLFSLGDTNIESDEELWLIGQIYSSNMDRKKNNVNL